MMISIGPIQSSGSHYVPLVEGVECEKISTRVLLTPEVTESRAKSTSSDESEKPRVIGGETRETKNDEE